MGDAFKDEDSMSQLSFDLACDGARQAADHADRVHPEWSALARQAIRDYAAKHEEFTTEDVITASPWVPNPPDKRAWGHIALAVKKEGVVEHAGHTYSKLRHAHCRPVTKWCSLVCAAVA